MALLAKITKKKLWSRQVATFLTIVYALCCAALFRVCSMFPLRLSTLVFVFEICAFSNYTDIREWFWYMQECCINPVSLASLDNLAYIYWVQRILIPNLRILCHVHLAPVGGNRVLVKGQRNFQFVLATVAVDLFQNFTDARSAWSIVNLQAQSKCDVVSNTSCSATVISSEHTVFELPLQCVLLAWSSDIVISLYGPDVSTPLYRRHCVTIFHGEKPDWFWMGLLINKRCCVGPMSNEPHQVR